MLDGTVVCRLLQIRSRRVHSVSEPGDCECWVLTYALPALPLPPPPPLPLLAVSLADYLAGKGWDVWTCELRGWLPFFRRQPRACWSVSALVALQRIVAVWIVCVCIRSRQSSKSCSSKQSWVAV